MMVRKAGIFALALLLAVGAGAATKKDYIDLVEQAVSAYTSERIADYIDDVDRRGICEHGFARLASNLATLVADGRMPERRDLLKRMMELCAREQPRAHRRNGNANTGHFAVGTEFAMKELVFALVELEKAKVYPKETTDAWRAAFSSVEAARDYSCQPKVGDPVAHNWTIFGTASEQVRLWAKAGGDAAWMEKYVADQLRFFDANGMYRDPHNPMVYDIVPRVQFATMLACGYDGPSRAALEATLDRSAQLTLEMQSVTGEIPYGGRSNQFLHNEILYAALCEWYAARAAKGGDRALAGRFRAAADRAVRHVRGWLAKKPVRHVKNCYPTETGYGCERYAYFNKYMVTMGSWAYLASRFVDESVPLATTPEPDSVFVTGPDFHRVMTSAGGYTLEFDLDGQEGYDASGLGRLQRAGAPSALALSVPFPVNAHYRMDVTNDLPRAIGPRWGKFALVSAKAGEIVLSDGGDARWTSRVTPAGVDLKVAQKGAIGFDLPVFAFDGETATSVTSGPNWIEVAYSGWTCRYETTGLFRDTGKVLGNRNGHYRLFEAQGEDRLTVRAKIVRAALTFTTELQREIDRTSAAGGGRVVVPAGRHETGAIFLKDGVTLELAEGCTLVASTNIADYVAFSRLAPDAPDFFVEVPGAQARLANCYAVVGAVRAKGVALVGKGEIDGRGQVALAQGKGNLAPGRWRDVLFYDCRDVRVEDVTLRNPATWTCYFKECVGVTVRRVTVDSHANHNNDGLDIDAKDVLVEDCRIDSTDDGICLKSDNPNFITENVLVRNCRVASNCSFLKLGTAGRGGFRNCRYEHCTLVPCRASPIHDWGGPTAARGITDRITGLEGIAIESVDGGICENIRFTDIDMTAGGVQTPIFVRLARRNRHPSGRPGTLTDVVIDGVRGKAASLTASSVTGVPGLRVKGVTIRNVDLTLKSGGTAADAEKPVPEVERRYPQNMMFEGILPAYGFYMRHADGVRFENVKLKLEPGAEARRPFVMDDAEVSFAD